MYSVTYKTKRGGSGVFTTIHFKDLEKKVVSLFKQRLESTIYKNGEEIGRVWKDNSQRTNWNYSINET